MILVVVLEMLQRFLGFLENVLPPIQQLMRKYSRCRSFMNGSRSDGR